MVKPDSFGVKNGWEITVILPKASEEYGPISHYFLVVVPTEEAAKDPGEFTIDEVKFCIYSNQNNVIIYSNLN